MPERNPKYNIEEDWHLHMFCGHECQFYFKQHTAKHFTIEIDMESIFPEPIRNLPKADIPLSGICAYLSQAEGHQILFVEFGEDVELPEHTHEAQLGIILEGKIELTIDGETECYEI